MTNKNNLYWIIRKFIINHSIIKSMNYSSFNNNKNSLELHHQLNFLY